VNEPVVFEGLDALRGEVADAAELRAAVFFDVRAGGRDVVELSDRRSRIARESVNLDLIAARGLGALGLPVDDDRLRIDRAAVVLVQPNHLALVVALRVHLHHRLEPALFRLLIEDAVEVVAGLVARVERDGRAELEFGEAICESTIT